MKRFTFLLLASVYMLAFWNCTDSGDSGEETKELSIQAETQSIVEASEGGECTFSITANGNWKLSGYATWCSVSPSVGGSGTTEIIIKIKSNSALYDDRSQTYTFQDEKGNVIGVSFTVTQKKTNALILSPEKYEANVNGDSLDVVVKSNLNYKVDIECSWITQTTTRGLVESKLNFKIAESDSTEARTGLIIFSDNNSELKDTITVYQADNRVLLLSEDNVIVSHQGEILTTELRTNLQYEIIMPDDEWIREQPNTRAFRNDRISFAIDPLSGDDNRETSIIFKEIGGDRTDTLNICQTADGSLLLMQSVFYKEYPRDTICVKIKQTEYTTKILDGAEVWIETHVLPIMTRSGFKKDSTYLAISQNTKSTTRIGKVLFTEVSTGIQDTLKIIQTGNTVTPVAIGNRAMMVTYDSKPSASQHTGIKYPLISWRLLKSDPSNISFDIYRTTNGIETKLNTESFRQCNWQDETANVTVTNTYRVVQGGTNNTLCNYEFTPAMAANFYREIILNTNVPDPSLTYYAEDAVIEELDGDGEYEIIVKRDVNPQDNTGDGIQKGTWLLEAYKLDGTFLWQIDMGKNCRQGAHYSPFIVCDLDGDGRAELAVRTSEGTRFGDGYQIGDVNNDGKTDYRNSSTGMVLSGPEFLSIIDGATGVEICRTDYIPRGDASTWMSYWGDNWGNRIDRFLMAAGCFDGIHNSIVMCRGYYHNFQLVALDFDGRTLTKRWHFNTDPDYPTYRGQGNHNLAVGDVDGDGYDEIIYGQCAIDHNGKGLYSTQNGHGDALHLGKFVPTRSGLQTMTCHESASSYNGAGTGYGTELRDAGTGAHIAGENGLTGDNGRCMIADIDPNYPGCEFWSSSKTGLYSCTGEKIGDSYPTGIGGGSMCNMAIWWDSTLNRQCYDRAVISSFKYGRRLTFSTGFGATDGCYGVGSKYTPCLVADIYGDFREEVILPSSSQTSLYIFSTNHPSKYRTVHLMEDHVYRMSVIHQNDGYNQPTHTGYYLGSDEADKFQ